MCRACTISALLLVILGSEEKELWMVSDALHTRHSHVLPEFPRTTKTLFESLYRFRFFLECVYRLEILVLLNGEKPLAVTEVIARGRRFIEPAKLAREVVTSYARFSIHWCIKIHPVTS